jgi:hypothetical protein
VPVTRALGRLLIALVGVCVLGLGHIGATPLAVAHPGDNGDVVFSRLQGEDYFDIVVVNADGSDEDVLLSFGGEPFSPAWSPDGTKIAYVSTGQVWVMDGDGSNSTQVTTLPVGTAAPDLVARRVPDRVLRWER